ncbi:hypothetical protein P618_200087 [Holospora obtusa F1]|uniref:Peptidase S11 D-alanyl-D-alanine carboxypeptidase A N-terminal domain-containing protein n=1 Tax=Holospora obtusa F1 TaxID=1399147 RepID=W6TEJ8_HOLOB|nr:hypothetical protein [Holospora obtusa]ETZ07718.1 hypothetical protein P618_200087 [Holospora obtusa F1]
MKESILVKIISKYSVILTMWMCAEALAKKQQFCYVILDPISRSVIEGVNEERRIFPASLTKLMTMFITFDALAKKK